MCGTAAVVVRVESITRGDTVYQFEEFDTIASLREMLTGIQCGELEDSAIKDQISVPNFASVPQGCFLTDRLGSSLRLYGACL